MRTQKNQRNSSFFFTCISLAQKNQCQSCFFGGFVDLKRKEKPNFEIKRVINNCLRKQKSLEWRIKEIDAEFLGKQLRIWKKSDNFKLGSLNVRIDYNLLTCYFPFPKSAIQINQKSKVIIIQTTPIMFFSIHPQSVMYQTPSYNYMPMNFFYFVANPPNFDKDLTLETYVPTNDLLQVKSSLDESIRAEKKKQKAEIKKLAAKRSQTLDIDQQDITQATKVPSGKKPKQNAQRNILPNIVHQIFCFVQKKKRSGRVVKQYLDSKNIPEQHKFNIERFYLYQKLIRDKTNNYINARGLAELNKFQEPEYEIYSQMEQLNFIRMNRILLRHFLMNQFDNIILTSSRMVSETRLWHFQLKRKIMDELNINLSGP